MCAYACNTYILGCVYAFGKNKNIMYKREAAIVARFIVGLFQEQVVIFSKLVVI